MTASPEAANNDDAGNTFLDGDTLVCRLVPGNGLSRQLGRTFDEVHRLESYGLRHVLIDCVDLLRIDPTQLRAFGAVDEKLRASGVQLLLLDARDGVVDKLTACLSGAILIDSTTGERSGAAECLSSGG